jgi:hypothetical protein
MKHSLCLVLILLMSFALSQSENITQTIRGNVTDRDTKSPLIGAKIIITSADPVKGAISDPSGNFKIENVLVGRINIQVSYIGYDPQTMNNVELTSGKELILNIKLQEKYLKEVIVHGGTDKTNAQNEMTSVSARTFSIDESMRYAGSLNDVARMAQNFAGVQGADDSRNDIVVRGNSPTGVLYRVEGIDVPNPNHFALSGTTGGPISILNNNVLDNSDFMTGAFPAEYGNALAGVFDLKLRAGNNQTHEFLVQIGFNGLEAMAEGPINKEKYSSYLFSYRYSTLGIFKALGINFGTGTSVPDYQDLTFKLDFPYAKGKISIWGIAGVSAVEFLDSDNDDATLFSETGEDLTFNSSIAVGGITNTYRFNDQSFLKTSFSMDGTLNNITSDTLNYSNDMFYPFYRNNSTEGKQTLNLIYQNKLSSRNLIKLGIYNHRRYFNLNDSLHIKEDSVYNPLTMQQEYVPDYWYGITQSKGSTYFIQPFAQWQFRANENITINTGLHSQYFHLNKTYAIEPRFGVKYNINKKTTLSFGYGLHNQLSPNRLYFKQVRDGNGEIATNMDGSPYIPGRDLQMTRSNHFVISADKSISDHSRIKAEAYYQLIDNAPVQQYDSYYSVLNYGANFDLAFPDTLLNNGTGTNYGVELTVERFLNKGFYYLLTTSLYESKYKGSDGVLRNTAFNGNYTSNFLIGKEFNLFVDKKDRKANSVFVIDLKSTLNGGQRYIPINLEESGTMGRAVYEYDRAFEEKYNDYFRIDVKLGYKRNGKKVTQEWSVNVMNLTNHRNVFQQVYSASTNTIDTRYQTGLLIIPQYKILF